ncbi:MAG TPA: MucR family transcriptional regulator [Methylomirabilota bacterium]|nr:MucR family transcriptional regulator [Methylomirabilota bacterium]
MTQPVAAATPARTARSGRGHRERDTRQADDFLALRADPRLAIEEEAIRCLLCGQRFRQLTNTHLRSHGTTAAEYKVRFGYNRGRPLMSRALQRLYAERARRVGLAARIRQRPIVARPELRRRGGLRPIALEEWLTRREARLKGRMNGSGPGPLNGASLL